MTERPGSRSGESGATVVVSGDIDIANRHEIVELVREAIRAETTEIAIDMSTVEFIDCAGLAGILQARLLAAMEGCDLRVVSMTPRVRRLLDLTETLPLLTGPPRPVLGDRLAELGLEQSDFG
ncbi:MAG TPA: STAS domain-containing protein [Ilumatobacteraceae bacterium]